MANLEMKHDGGTELVRQSHTVMEATVWKQTRIKKPLIVKTVSAFR